MEHLSYNILAETVDLQGVLLLEQKPVTMCNQLTFSWAKRPSLGGLASCRLSQQHRRPSGGCFIMAEPRECKRCSKAKRIVARGLCKYCYERERKAGNLSRYTDHRWKGGKDKIICPICFESFEAYPTWAGPRKYCSAKCMGLAERVISEDELQSVIELYLSGQSTSEIARARGISCSSVANYLAYNGIEIRPNWSYAQKYELDEAAFDVIDNEQAAYWLGFIYADGYIDPNANCLAVALKASDRHHLENLRAFLKSTHKIMDRQGLAPTSVIRFFGSHLALRLTNLGIVSRRGYFDKALANTPVEMYPHFIRGYLDGDGYISDPKTKHVPNVGFCGQDDILGWIKDTLANNTGASRNPKIRQKSGIKELAFGGHQIASILKWLYQGSETSLPRKLERANYWIGRL